MDDLEPWPETVYNYKTNIIKVTGCSWVHNKYGPINPFRCPFNIFNYKHIKKLESKWLCTHSQCTPPNLFDKPSCGILATYDHVVNQTIFFKAHHHSFHSELIGNYGNHVLDAYQIHTPHTHSAIFPQNQKKNNPFFCQTRRNCTETAVEKNLQFGVDSVSVLSFPETPAGCVLMGHSPFFTILHVIYLWKVQKMLHHLPRWPWQLLSVARPYL